MDVKSPITSSMRSWRGRRLKTGRFTVKRRWRLHRPMVSAKAVRAHDDVVIPCCSARRFRALQVGGVSRRLRRWKRPGASVSASRGGAGSSGAGGSASRRSIQ